MQSRQIYSSIDNLIGIRRLALGTAQEPDMTKRMKMVAIIDGLLLYPVDLRARFLSIFKGNNGVQGLVTGRRGRKDLEGSSKQEESGQEDQLSATSASLMISLHMRFRTCGLMLQGVRTKFT
jgi:hypothetical protein